MDNLLSLRHAGGDAFKLLNDKIKENFNVDKNPWIYAKVAKYISKCVFGEFVKDQWNLATKAHLSQREKLINTIITLIEYGQYPSVDSVLEHLEAKR